MWERYFEALDMKVLALSTRKAYEEKFEERYGKSLTYDEPFNSSLRGFHVDEIAAETALKAKKIGFREGFGAGIALGIVGAVLILGLF